jgi:hypothetical protein
MPVGRLTVRLVLFQKPDADEEFFRLTKKQPTLRTALFVFIFEITIRHAGRGKLSRSGDRDA